jgi:hypothetical protein
LRDQLFNPNHNAILFFQSNIFDLLN